MSDYTKELEAIEQAGGKFFEIGRRLLQEVRKLGGSWHSFSMLLSTTSRREAESIAKVLVGYARITERPYGIGLSFSMEGRGYETPSLEELLETSGLSFGCDIPGEYIEIEQPTKGEWTVFNNFEKISMNGCRSFRTLWASCLTWDRAPISLRRFLFMMSHHEKPPFQQCRLYLMGSWFRDSGGVCYVPYYEIDVYSDPPVQARLGLTEFTSTEPMPENSSALVGYFLSCG